MILPAAMPNALVGLRYSLGSAWLALVFGETINASAGIGYEMNMAREWKSPRSAGKRAAPARSR